MYHLARARGNLLVVKRYEDILRIAAIDPVAIAIKHVNVDKMRVRIDLPSGPMPPERPITRSPDRATSSTQISLESTVP